MFNKHAGYAPQQILAILDVFNTSGIEVFETAIKSNPQITELDASEFDAGVYNVAIKSSNKGSVILRNKLVVIH